MIDRIMNVLQGKVTGESLLSIWRHYPLYDLNPIKLTYANLKDYRRYSSDLIKLSPHGRFCVADFGCEVEPGVTSAGESGSSHCKNTVVNHPQDWGSIDYVDPNDGHLGMQLEYIRLMKQELPEVPMMMTLFAPTMIGQFLSNKQMYRQMQEPDHRVLIEDALEVIANVMIEFTSACLDAGVDGFFAAVQELDRTKFSSSQIGDMIGLNTKFMRHVSNTGEFTVLHLHGSDVAFEQGIKAYKPTAVNWHDRTSQYSLSNAAEVFDGGLLGGLDPVDVFSNQFKESVSQAKKLREEIPLILAPGCVLLQGTSDNIIDEIIQLYRK